jgi:hypothetical protein
VILAWVILALALAVVFFFFQATSLKILRRQFDQEYFQSIANVIRLEFPSLRKSLEGSGVPVDYRRLRRTLKSDFFALIYLRKNAANVNQRFSNEERLLLLYFRWHLLSLAVRRLLRVGEKKAILKLTSVLGYFANVVDQQADIMQHLASEAEVPGDARGA